MPRKYKKRKNKFAYAVYDRRDNNLCVCIGEAEEVAKFLGVSKSEVYCLVTRHRQAKLNTNTHWLVEKIDEAEFAEDD